MNEQLWWFVARSTGLVSWALLTISVVWGVLLSARLLGKRPAPAWLLDLHRHLGGLSVVFVAVHLVALVADSYVAFGLVDLFVPFASAWKPGPVAWGVVGLYLLLAVEITSLMKKRLGVKVWRRVHALAFPLWVLATVHFALAGTDATQPVVAAASIAVGGATVFTTAVRLLSPKPARAPRAAASRAAAPVAAADPADVSAVT